MRENGNLEGIRYHARPATNITFWHRSASKFDVQNMLWLHGKRRYICEAEV